MGKTNGAPRRTGALFAWAFYDWANSSFPTVITTFVFSAYFTKAVAPDPITGTELWGYAMSASALAVAVAGPLFGAVADRTGRRKPWIAVLTLICVLATASLWFALPGATGLIWILAAAAVANFGFETGMVFYNAMLSDLAPDDRVGRWSGWGWGIGYFGGLVCLAICLVGFVQPEDPWFGVGTENAANIRAVAPLVSVWFAVFSLPLFLFTPDTPAAKVGLGTAVRDGVTTLRATLRNIRRHGRAFRFLIARMIYTDGMNTLFAFGGIYAAGTFDMPFDELILFGIGMNVTAGLGAGAFAWIDDRVGPRKTVLFALVCLTFFGLAAVLVTDKSHFWIVGMGLGTFVGPVQSASRSFMTRLAPPKIRNEMFGLYALSGKATSFLGPMVLGAVTAATASQRYGMATILVFFVIGGALLWPISDARHDQ